MSSGGVQATAGVSGMSHSSALSTKGGATGVGAGSGISTTAVAAGAGSRMAAAAPVSVVTGDQAPEISPGIGQPGSTMVSSGIQLDGGGGECTGAEVTPFCTAAGRGRGACGAGAGVGAAGATARAVSVRASAARLRRL